MENEYRERHRRTSERMRRTRDITMAVLILGMACVLFFGVQWNIPQIVYLDNTLRLLLGGIFALYGIFRLYRGIKSDY
jgi:hypothetical protein